MSDSAAKARLSQESVIESGRAVILETVTDRVLRMFGAIRAYGPLRVSRRTFRRSSGTDYWA